MSLQSRHRHVLLWVISLVLCILGILLVAWYSGWSPDSDSSAASSISDEVRIQPNSLGAEVIPEYVLSELNEEQKDAIKQAFGGATYRLIASESHEETLEQRVEHVLDIYEKHDALLRWNGFLDVQGHVWSGLFQEKRWIELCLVYTNTQENTRTLTWRLDFKELRERAQELLHTSVQ